MSLSESPVILVDRKAADGFEKHDPAYNGQLDQAIGGGDVVFEELSEMIDAAVKVQKAFRGHRERCMLADSAIASEELWSKALDFAAMNQSTISFFKSSTPETAVSRWNRVSSNASKVGKGLVKDDKAQKLIFQHWIEAIDPRHRYGKNLHVYYDEWSKADSGQPFFYWLDIGDGKELDLQKCPRSKLREQCVKYLGPKEREQYEYIVREGKLIHKQTGDVLDTQADMSIFVMSTSKQLYVGQKKRGRFHHSSFLAGGVTIVAGTLGAENGTLKSISPFTGHYQTTSERLETFLSFFKENGVNLSEVQVSSSNFSYLI
ncbi:IQ domain-containing protein IQM3 [Morus notabilis]|uniref:IQ domain-containing protein IQM3 n=1 Tax=Morus notabilis TaxID=981085 RepID=UPI000CECFD4F|nr:IQ domain-containing protein IQM3 [Morus notabilis]